MVWSPLGTYACLVALLEPLVGFHQFQELTLGAPIWWPWNEGHQRAIGL